MVEKYARVEFRVETGLHQGSALGPIRIATLIDKSREECHLSVMFVANPAISGKSRVQVEENQERWRYDLERRGVKVRQNKCV